MNWTAGQIPDQSGRVAIVTGANSGLGFETVVELARHGAKVVMACRDRERGEAARRAVENRVGTGCDLEVRALDLGDLDAVRAFADGFAADYSRLDLLINNAGVMAIPLTRTKQGFEMQFGVNHLAHYALSGRLFGMLVRTAGSRVVTVASNVHFSGRIAFDDLQSERSYSRWPAYSQSKLANLLFAYELRRRIEAKGLAVVSIAAHPGYAATELQARGPRMSGSALRERMFALGNRLFAQSAAMGALPQLHAATAELGADARYIGPHGIGGLAGHPVEARSSARSRDRTAARRLWRVSEELTGVVFAELA